MITKRSDHVRYLRIRKRKRQAKKNPKAGQLGRVSYDAMKGTNKQGFVDD